MTTIISKTTAGVVIATAALLGSSGVASARPGPADPNPAPKPAASASQTGEVTAKASVPGAAAAQTPKAAATVVGPDKLGWGRAAILFTRDETLKIGLGGLPALPPRNPVTMAITIARAGIGAIALNYYNRGLCSAYTVSARPWDSQGFTSRKC